MIIWKLFEEWKVKKWFFDREVVVKCVCFYVGCGVNICGSVM